MSINRLQWMGVYQAMPLSYCRLKLQLLLSLILVVLIVDSALLLRLLVGQLVASGSWEMIVEGRTEVAAVLYIAMLSGWMMKERLLLLLMEEGLYEWCSLDGLLATSIVE